MAAGQLFVVVKGTVTFVPLAEIAGKSEESVKDIVVEKVTESAQLDALIASGASEA